MCGVKNESSQSKIAGFGSSLRADVPCPSAPKKNLIAPEDLLTTSSDKFKLDLLIAEIRYPYEESDAQTAALF